MQHLKPMGNNPEAVFLEAPGKREKPKPGGLVLRDEEQDGKDRTLIHLPTSVLPSTVEIGGSRRDTGLENGLQPDMDPRLREVMEALEDEEYVEDQLQDSFFDELNEEGELYDPEEEEWEEEEEEEEEVEEVFDNDGTYDWQAAFRNFQKNKKQEGSDDEDQEEKADRQTVGTGFSMSSSVMHRNSQLRLLDDRFEKIEEEYMNDDDEEEDEFGEERADFDDILDDFLDKYEVVGKKMQFKLDGDTSEQLATIRQALTVTHLSEHNESILTAKVKEPKKDTNGENLWSRPVQRERAAWDCQSVLSTYSNLENHPQLISDRGPKKKITIDPKTGMPVLIEVERKLRKKNMKKEEEDENEEDEEDEEDEEARQNLGVRRSKEESKEDKKLRKQAVKDAKKVKFTLSFLSLTPY
ncbi:hypothetical protein BDF14DRAFT_1793395 [Spinellus fusiger]|nr:hypothetical protein BDF14DRAFT_1793395 [Spinellus fusiger]